MGNNNKRKYAPRVYWPRDKGQEKFFLYFIIMVGVVRSVVAPGARVFISFFPLFLPRNDNDNNNNKNGIKNHRRRRRSSRPRRFCTRTHARPRVSVSSLYPRMCTRVFPSTTDARTRPPRPAAHRRLQRPRYSSSATDNRTGGGGRGGRPTAAAGAVVNCRRGGRGGGVDLRRRDPPVGSATLLQPFRIERKKSRKIIMKTKQRDIFSRRTRPASARRAPT